MASYEVFYRVNPQTDKIWKSYLADTYADLATSGLTAGEWAVCKDTTKIYIANSTTTFVEKSAGGTGGVESHISLLGESSPSTI